MRLRDRAFQRVFSRLFVYNILWEDSEVDERFLDLGEDSTVLGISGAGCRIAGHLSQRPRRIDAVDINQHHLALAALKVAGAQRLRSYACFYDLFGRGAHPEHATLLRWLTGTLPEWVQRYWQRRHRLFRRAFYREGLTARMFAALRRLVGLDGEWLRELSARPLDAREQMVEDAFAPVLRRPLVAAMIESPVQLVALGINFAQRDRLLAGSQAGFVEVMVDHLKRVAATDLERNWFAWTAIAGHYNHDVADAVPPYLRRDRHARSFGAPTRVEFHHRDIFDVLAAAGPGTWSHYTLCDAPDWMPAPAQRRLLTEILRTSRDGGIVMYRSVEPDSLVARHGLEDRLVPLAERSRAASALDRSRQYQAVNYYRIVH
jgi:S-adenosylmethionine-diacylglycerol 3-amino-3-carboxypropyl transferase